MASRFEIFLKKAGLGAWLVLNLICVNFLTLSAIAQSNNAAAYTWTTFAGTSGMGNADGVGGNAQFNHPAGAAVDTNGNVYVADTFNNTIRKITPAGRVSTLAGFAGSSGSADGLNSAARFNGPSGTTIDSAGNLYVVDSGNNTIRKINPAGTNWVVSTLAGRPQFDLAGDPLGGSTDGTGTNALFDQPEGIAVDGAGNLYVTDRNNYTIRKLTRTGTNWLVSTIAGSAGNQGHLSSNNDGTNGVARFGNPYGITVDNATNLYVADDGDSTIRKIRPIGTNWVVSTIAGLSGNFGTADGTGSAAQFSAPRA